MLKQTLPEEVSDTQVVGATNAEKGHISDLRKARQLQTQVWAPLELMKDSSSPVSPLIPPGCPLQESGPGWALPSVSSRCYSSKLSCPCSHRASEDQAQGGVVSSCLLESRLSLAVSRLMRLRRFYAISSCAS